METLRVGAAVPAPPFNGMPGDTGLDIELMTELAQKLGATAEFGSVEGAEFDNLFAALNAGDYDCAASGISVTPAREHMATFAPPYLISGQALAVDVTRRPRVRSVDDLAGLIIGAQRGDTGLALAERLVAEGRAASVRTYDRGDAGAALADLTNGACDALVTLAPTLAELVKPVSGVQIVQKGLTVEHIAIAVKRSDQALLGRLSVTQAELEQDGTLQRIRRKWLGSPYADQSLALH
ncbi:ABC transporter substrate-binding protein [Mycolicibacterium sp. XJ1819]